MTNPLLMVCGNVPVPARDPRLNYCFRARRAPFPALLQWTLNPPQCAAALPCLSGVLLNSGKMCTWVFEVRESKYGIRLALFVSVCAKNASRPATCPFWEQIAAGAAPLPSPFPGAYKIQVKYVMGVFEVKESNYDFRITWSPIGCAGMAPAFWIIVTLNLSSPPNGFKSS